MIDSLIYLVGTVVLGGGLAFVIAMFKVGPGKPEFSVGRTLVACLTLTIGGPFAAIEVQTRMRKTELGPAVRAWYAKSGDIEGKLVGMKVLLANASKATVLVIGQEKASWGDDRPIVRLKLHRDGAGAWKVEDSTVLRSSRLDKDLVVFPPYQ